jgi:hypothetical protein
MKPILIILGLLSAHILLVPSAHAQAPDFIFSSFQCDPTLCQETGPLSTVSSAFVSVNSTCTGGVIDGLNKTITTNVGIPTACILPYTPFALVESFRTELLDDCGDPYFVDTMRLTGEVFSFIGSLVFNLQVEFSCDGGEGSPTVFGEKPC